MLYFYGSFSDSYLNNVCSAYDFLREIWFHVSRGGYSICPRNCCRHCIPTADRNFRDPHTADGNNDELIFSASVHAATGR